MGAQRENRPRGDAPNDEHQTRAKTPTSVPLPAGLAAGLGAGAGSATLATGFAGGFFVWRAGVRGARFAVFVSVTAAALGSLAATAAVSGTAAVSVPASVPASCARAPSMRARGRS